MIPATLADFAVPLDSLVPYERNPRRGDVAAIAESLATNGQYRPIVARSGTNEVLAGNHTLAAARQLGWDKIAATFVEVTDDQAARIVLVDNRAGDLASNDNRELMMLLRELDVSEQALSGTGYGEEDLDDLAALLSQAEQEALVVRTGTTTNDGENAWQSPDLKEYADRYEEQGRRLIVLDYDRPDYVRVTSALDRLRAELGVESNSAAVLAHLAELFPDVAGSDVDVAS